MFLTLRTLDSPEDPLWEGPAHLYDLGLVLIFLLHGLYGGQGEHTLHARVHQL